MGSFHSLFGVVFCCVFLISLGGRCCYLRWGYQWSPLQSRRWCGFFWEDPFPHSGRVGALQTHLPAFVLWMNGSVSRGLCGIKILRNVVLFLSEWPRGSAYCLGLLIGLQLPVYLVWFWVSLFLWTDPGASLSFNPKGMLLSSSPFFILLLLFGWHRAHSSNSPLAQALRWFWAYYVGNSHVHYPMYIYRLDFSQGPTCLLLI